MRKRLVIVVCVVCMVAATVGGWMAYYTWKFPYGLSHCCIIGMMNALEQYAEENGGRYPAGETSSEASLSLLYRSNYIDAYTLRGMTVPAKTAEGILQGGGLLGPDSCGWYYVPGLTKADDPGLALLWCKTALGHNGDRTRDGGRQVVFVGKGIQWISGGRWSAFVKEQKALMEQRRTRAVSGMPLVSGIIELPDGTHLNRIDGLCWTREETKGSDSMGNSSSSGTGCELLWYRAPIQDGTVTRTLSFSNFVSDPVTITFEKGIPNTTNFVYKMRSRR